MKLASLGVSVVERDFAATVRSSATLAGELLRIALDHRQRSALPAAA